MNKYMFISSEITTKAFFISIVLWFFSLYLILFLFWTFLIATFFLFRIKQFDISDKRFIESNVITSPVTGTFVEERLTAENKVLVFKIYPWQNYGIHMPVNGEFLDYFVSSEPLNFLKFASLKLNVYKVESTIKLKLGSKIKMSFVSILKIKKANLFTRGGDRGVLGSIMGYLPFGGDVIIEVPLESEVLVKQGDKVLSFQTILGSIRES